MIHLFSQQNAQDFGRNASFLRTSYSFSIVLILSLLLTNVQASGSNTTATSLTDTLATEAIENLVICKVGKCELQINAQKDRVDEMVLSARNLFEIYKTKNMTVDEEGLNKLMVDVGLIREKLEDGHAHAVHHKDEHHDEEEDHTRKRRSQEEQHDEHEECHLVKEIEEKYTNGKGNLELSFDSFLTILPQLLMDRVQNEACFFTTDHSEETEVISPTKVWLIALGSVLAISLLSIIGLLTVPLMKFSKFYNRCMAGLIALAVGTLVADAILHLLPHAASDASDSHDHSSHDHDAEKIYKHLMVVVGIYGFYLFETLMNLYRIRKVKKRRKQPDTMQDNDVAKRLAQDDVSQAIVYTGNGSGEVLTSNSESNLRKMEDGDALEMGHHHHHHHGEEGVDHEHRCSHSHPPEHLIKDGGNNTIMDMAWMVIAGDGLHNFSDGLAIGAAFSSTIAAGLSTSFAIFFHELPHELGDFAVLIKAGMSITQALTYNIICAGLAIVGTIIGLLIGEYTTNFKMWVLALTAGGFLYVALVDMLPGLIKISCDETDRWKFVIVQIGLLSGIAVMLVIALYEGSFQTMFE